MKEAKKCWTDQRISRLIHSGEMRSTFWKRLTSFFPMGDDITFLYIESFRVCCSYPGDKSLKPQKNK